MKFMDIEKYSKALAIQVTNIILKNYKLEELIKPLPSQFIPRVARKNVIYKIGTDPIVTCIDDIRTEAAEKTLPAYDDPRLVEIISDAIDLLLPEIKNRIEDIYYNYPGAAIFFVNEIAKILIKHLPEKERKKQETLQAFITFLDSFDEEKYKQIENIIRNKVKFYAIKTTQKTKTRHIPLQDKIFENKKENLSEKDILIEIGRKLQNLNALRDKAFNISMLKNGTPTYTNDFFSSITTKRITELAEKAPNHKKLVKYLWKKAFIKQMTDYYSYRKEEMNGAPSSRFAYFHSHKRKEDRFYVNVNALLHSFSKLKKTFPYTEHEKWIQKYETNKIEYYRLIEDYAEIIHISYILKNLMKSWNIPKMPGWLINLSIFWKDISRYAKRTEYAPIKAKEILTLKPQEKQQLKPEKTKQKPQEKVLTLF